MEPTVSQVVALIREMTLRDTGTANSILFLDSNLKIAQDNANFFYDPTNAQLNLKQPTSTNALMKVRGTATADVLTGTLVAGATVTTATKAGFVRVNVTDDGGVMTTGDYYIQVFTVS